MRHRRIERLHRQRHSLLTLIALTIILSVGCTNLVSAQVNSTPVPLNLPSQLPTATPDNVPVPTGSRAPIDLSGASNTIVTAEALDPVTGTNVRQGPSADSGTLIIGKILAGKLYRIIGKNGDWLEIQYDKPVDNTPGWVYSKIVKVTGSLSSVPQVDPASVPTANQQDVADQQTAAYLAQTPGAPGSATAKQGSATGVSILQPTATAEPSPGGPLVTFTFPPPFAVATLMPSTTSTRTAGSVPPILPIVGFAALGLLGLVLSGARRS